MLCNVAKEKKRKKMHVLKFLRVNFSLLHCCVILFIYCIVIIITIFGFLIRCVEFISFVPPLSLPLLLRKEYIRQLPPTK